MISIVMCAKNSSSTIRKALNSLVYQDFWDYELIVVDGLSTDDTLDIIAEYKFKRLQVVQQDGEGIYNAFNTGVKCSRGEYVFFLHTDDSFASCDVLRHFLEISNVDEYDVIFGNVEYRNKDGLLLREVRSSEFTHSMLGKGFMPPHTGTFVKRYLFYKYGLFDENFGISGDYEWLLRVLKEDVITRYWDKKICSMTLGGASNASLKARFFGLLEDIRAARKNHIPLRAVLWKKYRALKSFL